MGAKVTDVSGVVDRPTSTLDRCGAAHQGRRTVAGGAPAPNPWCRPGLGLPLVVLIGLLAAFFALVSAAPFWLANGAGHTGTATVVGCQHRTLGDRCAGRFVAADGSFTTTARLVNLDPADRSLGRAVRARMLRPDSDVAYTGPVSGLRLRWSIGFALVLGCGVAIGLVTGVPRLRAEGHRRVATLWALCVSGPGLLLLLALAAALC